MKTNRPSDLIWTSEKISATYRTFFTTRAHLELPGSPLVAPNTSTYFTVAGMQPLLPYLRGQQTPPSPCLTSLQRCLRTVDVAETGKTNRKMTLFHMLGNWSIDNYGKRGAIEMAVELLHMFGLDFQRLWITTFGGEPSLNLPPDDVAFDEWRRQGFPVERIIPLGMEDNFWDLGAQVPGPCGLCTEIFVDYGPGRGCGRLDCRPGCTCERFLEVWNLVFIEFERSPEGRLSRLPFLSIDTGMGLERIGMVLQQVPSVFDIDLFRPALDVLRDLTPGQPEPLDDLTPVPQRRSEGFKPIHPGCLDGPTTDQSEHSRDQLARRVILDHTRAALFILLEGVGPGEKGQNSVVRRLLRRAIRQGRLLGLSGPFLAQLVEPLLSTHAFLLPPEQRENGSQLREILSHEERQFQRTLSIGLKLLEQLQPDERGLISGKDIFRLHSDRGFPSDLAEEILGERGLSIDWSGYEQAFEQHRQVSRLSVQSQFRRS